MTKNMEEGYHGSATSLKSSSGHLQERKEWKGSRGNKNQRKQQPNFFVTENLINNQSEKEMEIFIHVNLRIITQESSQKALRTVLVRQVGKLVCLWFGKGACAFKRTSQQMVAVNGFGAFVIIERARNWVHNIFSWKFQSIWGPALQVLPGHKVPQIDLHPEFLSGCIYHTLVPVVANGLIFVQLDDGQHSSFYNPLFFQSFYFKKGLGGILWLIDLIRLYV